MHLLAQEIRSLDEAETAVDLGQSPADLVVLSFTDSDLAAVAAAWKAVDGPRPSLRLANLGRLKHPYSVDLHLERVASRARAIIVRCLGGADYWRYGIDELAVLSRSKSIALAIVPGDHVDDPRLDRASTLPEPELRRIWTWFQEGGPTNMGSLIGYVSRLAGHPCVWREPEPLPAAARYESACRAARVPIDDLGRRGEAPRALILSYRSLLLAADTAPIEALAEALAERGLSTTALSVTSLKDPRAVIAIAEAMAAEPPNVILNTTAFSGRLEDGSTVLERAGVPVLQAILPTTPREAWAASPRGLGAADLAMNVVLPELDGRIVTRPISFKRDGVLDAELEFARTAHEPEPSRIAHVADLAAAWVRLQQAAPAERRVALVLSDYPAKRGRTGYAVGLDTPASVGTITEALGQAGYAVGSLPSGDTMMACLEGRAHGAEAYLSLADYRRMFTALPQSFQAAVTAAWGDPATDPAQSRPFDPSSGLRPPSPSRGEGDQDAFRFPVVGTGNIIVAVQPDRGRTADRKASYHDANLPPRHGYIAFYLWLRHVFQIDAMIHLGTHGTLEWLPGKAVALTDTCAPEVLVGATPVIYPFIVNNPGEAGQARRRLGALTLGHMTPPLVTSASHGAAGEIEALLDEYAAAQGLDPPRARRLADAIVARARETGLLAESGFDETMAPADALARIDDWLCDIKDLRIGDGLHVLGRSPTGKAREDTVAMLSGATGSEAQHIEALLEVSAKSEIDNLLAALDGRFIPAGPAGAPLRGRLDVLPTGRNLTAADPRAIPTQTAWELGRRTAAEVMTRHAQDHGEWPRQIIIDLWGSATMRTGGDDLAQALALMGAKPVWDAASGRVNGYEIVPQSRLDRPRVDVTLRVSGLFRDIFPTQIALFDEASRAVAALDEDDDINPLAAERRAGKSEIGQPRIFGTAPGTYGAGLTDGLNDRSLADRDALGRAYLAASSHAYGVGAEGIAAPEAFAARVAGADAFVHVQDIDGQDVLDSAPYAEHEGGFAAAAAMLGSKPALYHGDSSRGGAAKIRTLAEEIARVVRGRATNPRWIAGQMRHGHRGAAEIAETVGNLFAFAATTTAVSSRQFDLVYDATLGDEHVRDFMIEANPDAARATALTFAEAARRGFWESRRNSTAAALAQLCGAAA